MAWMATLGREFNVSQTESEELHTSEEKNSSLFGKFCCIYYQEKLMEKDSLGLSFCIRENTIQP